MFVHDQGIINAYELNGYMQHYFGNDYTYVFVGHGQCDKLYGNIIRAIDYTDNIEQYKKAVAYTGWYLLWKNNLIQSEYVNLFEYDLKFKPKMKEIDLCEDVDIKHYLQLPIDDQYYPVIVNSVTYNRSIETQDPTWMVTTNLTWKTETFKKFMQWYHEGHFLPNAENPQIGHIFERYISHYHMTHNEVTKKFYHDTFEHLQLDSHDTQGIHHRFQSFMTRL